MSGITAPERDLPATPRHSLLAWLLVLGWSLGGALGARVGLWQGVAGTGLALGILSFVAERHVLLALLRPTGRLVGIGIGAAFVMLAATYGLFPLARHLVPPLQGQTTLLYASFGPVTPSTLFLLPVVVVCEELIWRGVVQEALGRAYSRPGEFILTPLVYAAASVPAGSALLVLLALACGLYWCALRAWTRSLVPCLVAHVVWDVLVLVVLPLGRTQ